MRINFSKISRKKGKVSFPGLSVHCNTISSVVSTDLRRSEGQRGFGHLECLWREYHSLIPKMHWPPTFLCEPTLLRISPFFSHGFSTGLHRPNHRHLDTFPLNFNHPWLIVPASWDLPETRLGHPEFSLPTLCQPLRIWEVYDLCFYFKHRLKNVVWGSTQTCRVPCTISLPPSWRILQVVFGWYSVDLAVSLHLFQWEIRKDLVKYFHKVQAHHAHFISLIKLARRYIMLAMEYYEQIDKTCFERTSAKWPWFFFPSASLEQHPLLTATRGCMQLTVSSPPHIWSSISLSTEQTSMCLCPTLNVFISLILQRYVQIISLRNQLYRVPQCLFLWKSLFPFHGVWFNGMKH